MDLTDNAILSIVFVHLMQWLKNLKWVKPITNQSDSLNRFLSWVFAFGASLGIGIVTQGDLLNQGLSVTINIPALMVLVKNFIINRGLQEVYYKVGVKANADISGTK